MFTSRSSPGPVPQVNTFLVNLVVRFGSRSSILDDSNCFKIGDGLIVSVVSGLVSNDGCKWFSVFFFVKDMRPF